MSEVVVGFLQTACSDVFRDLQHAPHHPVAFAKSPGAEGHLSLHMG